MTITLMKTTLYRGICLEIIETGRAEDFHLEREQSSQFGHNSFLPSVRKVSRERLVGEELNLWLWWHTMRQAYLREEEADNEIWWISYHGSLVGRWSLTDTCSSKTMTQHSMGCLRQRSRLTSILIIVLARMWHIGVSLKTPVPPSCIFVPKSLGSLQIRDIDLLGLQNIPTSEKT